MTGTVISKQRNKILEKFADHILKESCPHCQSIVRHALIAQDQECEETHCSKCGEWLEGGKICPECGKLNYKS